MKRLSGSIIVIITLIIFSSDLFARTEGYKKIHWKSEKIAPGLKWKSSHTVLNDSVPQNINLLIISLHKRKLSLAYTPGKNNIVSKQARESKAIAAVNAGFFNIKEGGSVTYIRTGGVIAEADTAKKWTRNSNLSGSLLIDRNGHVKLSRAKTNNWYDSHPEYPDVLVTGPLLLSEKIKANLPSTPLVINRHPRTAVGTKGNHRIILLTLDGRTDEAKGMTVAELTDFMVFLRCRDAVNLDGGGSTTMWISGKPFSGVVNMPCDNKKFDHEGERAVSDILIVR
jgi:exopolysaccharide biosynthesis protein